MQYKLKHRLSAALMAGAMCCTMIPAASADEIATPETVDTAVPEVTDSVTPALSQITENLYNDLPDRWLFFLRIPSASHGLLF